ncbi:hypothetical protein J4Q44_G00130080, partial [Coregonus suidteri]
VSELLLSGPSSITETTVPGESLLRWTPTEDEEGGYYPVCFIAQGVNDSSKYHSELRCVIVSVGNTSAIRTTQNATALPTTTQPTTELTTAPTNFMNASNTTTTMTTTLSTNPTTNLTTNNVVNTLNIIGPRYIVGLRIKLSSLITLTDDYIRNVVLQQLREELIRRGLPGNFTLRLRATYEISP